MIVRPNDLANVCVLFPILRTRRLAQCDLEAYVQKGLSLDTVASSREIVEACINCGLLSTSGRYCIITDIGKKLAEQQKGVSPSLSNGAKRCILQNVYLNPDSGTACCQPFILLFRVDSVRNTFVYDRIEDESVENIRWMQLLNSVGLLDVSADMASVRSDHLPLINDFLRKARSFSPVANIENENELNEVGDIAEEKAVEDEKARLIAAGYNELVCLVQRISGVDKTAGYDVVSCRGSGRIPEQPIYIEVKGTRKSDVCFIWSQNERVVAAQKGRSYWLYVYTDINISLRSTKGPVRINNPVVRLDRMGYILEPLDVYVTKKSI